MISSLSLKTDVYKSEELLTGCEAVAQGVRLADVDVIAAYPIRPYTDVMDRISKIIAVTVDLPLVPVTAIVRIPAAKDSRISDLCRTGTPARRAAFTSGTLSSTAVEITSPSQPGPMPEPSCG